MLPFWSLEQFSVYKEIIYILLVKLLSFKASLIQKLSWWWYDWNFAKNKIKTQKLKWNVHQMLFLYTWNGIWGHIYFYLSVCVCLLKTLTLATTFEPKRLRFYIWHAYSISLKWQESQPCDLDYDLYTKNNLYGLLFCQWYSYFSSASCCFIKIKSISKESCANFVGYKMGYHIPVSECPHVSLSLDKGTFQLIYLMQLFEQWRKKIRLLVISE